MEQHIFAKNYVSPQRPAASFPSLRFYCGLAGIFWRAAKVAKAGEYSGERWAFDSKLVGRLIEDMGTRVIIEGVENLDFEGANLIEIALKKAYEIMEKTKEVQDDGLC
jgi:hypothetical protein